MGLHWSKSCNPPQFTEEQLSIVDGLIAGGSDVSNPGSNFRVRVSDQNQEFLNWLSEELGVHATEVNHRSDGTHGIAVRATTVTSHTVERWTHDGDDFDWPLALDINPLNVNLWYSRNGHIHFDEEGSPQYVILSARRLGNRIEEVRRQLSKKGFPANKVEPDSSSTQLRISNVEGFLEWIGPPPVGVEWKWNLVREDYVKGSVYQTGEVPEGESEWRKWNKLSASPEDYTESESEEVETETEPESEEVEQIRIEDVDHLNEVLTHLARELDTLKQENESHEQSINELFGRVEAGDLTVDKDAQVIIVKGS